MILLGIMIYQHGVRARKSGVTKAAVYFIESKINSVYKDEPCVEILMDISKTFDNIDPSALLEKLKYLEIKKSTLKLMVE